MSDATVGVEPVVDDARGDARPVADGARGDAHTDVRRGAAGPEVVELAAVPSLGGLYARGVAGSARFAASRRRGVDAADLPSTRVVVRGVRADADHLTAYQHVVGEPALDALPAGFVHVLAFPVATALMVRPDFPLPLLGMIHVANHVEQRRAMRLGEAVDVTVHAEGLRAHRAGVTVDVHSRVSVGGDQVWHGVSTYLAKGVRLAPGGGARVAVAQGVPGGGNGPSGAGGRAEAARSDRSAWIPPTPTGLWRLGPDVGRRYAAVSGDRNPIHTSSLAAKAFGFPRTIAHGMYTAARALADVGAARGEAFTWDVEFATAVRLPSTVTVGLVAGPGTWTVDGWDARSSRRHLTVTVRSD